MSQVLMSDDSPLHLEESHRDQCRHYTDEDADDEDDMERDDESVMSGGRKISVITHPLNLEGSIVIGGHVRRDSTCSCSSNSCSSTTSSNSSSSSRSSSSDTHKRRRMGQDTLDEHDMCLKSSEGYSGNSVSEVEEEEELAYPGYPRITLFCLAQNDHPRDWCLQLVNNPWFERLCMFVILLNCVTLGMYQPCEDAICRTSRCKILQISDDLIFGFFALEMSIKMVAMGAVGKNAYLTESWNRLDFFIVLAGSLEYCMDVGDINFSAIRTIRVLRPLRAINRIPSLRILVMLLLDTLPMLGNVLLLCFFVFFIFGILAVQLWAGVLRQRCFLDLPENISFPEYLSPHYSEKVKVVNPLFPSYQSLETDRDYICSLGKDNGIHRCENLPPSRFMGKSCTEEPLQFADNRPTNSSCVNWNKFYTDCRPGDRNPFQGAVSFDNIGLSWVAIFLVISLEGWTDIMYFVQDAHSFWDWIYFVLLIVVGSFFMINLCLVVIATQFSETKKREMERMRLERALACSSSTITSASGSEHSGCYTQMFKYVAHIGRRARRKFLRYCRRHKRKKHLARDVPCSLSLRTRTLSRPKWKPGQSSMKTDSSCPGTAENRSSTTGSRKTAAEQMAPCASPEDSDVELGNSPREVETSVSGSFKLAAKKALRNKGGECYQQHHYQQRHSSSSVISGLSRRPSQFTCAELLAIGATQGAAPAGFARAMNNFYSDLTKNENHYSAPQLFYYTSDKEGSEECKARHKHRCHDSWSSHSGTCSDSDDVTDNEKAPTSRFYRWFKEKQGRIKYLVDHQYFQKGMLTAILVNTLSMGIEYHNQPDELTLAVEISNVIFTIVFLMEMLMKICAEGLFSYISSGYNVFDSVIVILSLVELCQSSGSGLSVLRTFRLLRILKLVRFLPALRRQLFVMMRTVDNVAVFFALLILFIFIFSILGMTLFGCKFCKQLPDGARQCDRKNFDNLLWAIVTVFQILTQEDWNVVLFNGMEKTSHWAALYFVALMTLGNYVLFNLLVAILVEGFSAEDEKKSTMSSASRSSDFEKGDLETSTDKEQLDRSKSVSDIKLKGVPYVLTVVKPDQCNMSQIDNLCFAPLITHTAATPQGSPNTTLIMPKDSCNRLCTDTNHHLSDTSIISIDKSTTRNSLTSEVVQLNGLPVIQVATLNLPSINLNSLPQNGARNSVVLSLSRQSSIVSNLSRRSSLGLCFLQRNGSKSSNSSNSYVTEKPKLNTWKNHKRKNDNESSENESGSEDVLHNNNNNNNNYSNAPTVKLTHCNGSIAVLKTSSHHPSNGIGSPRLLSPQNSIRSCSFSINNSSEDTQRKLPRSRQASINGSVKSRDLFGLVSGNNNSNESRRNSAADSTAKVEANQGLKLDDSASKAVDDNCHLTEKLCWIFEPKGWIKEREDYSLFLFSKSHWVRRTCNRITEMKAFDYTILVFIALNCITLAMERPSIPPDSYERLFLIIANNTFTAIFSIEMLIKVLAKGLWYGPSAYFKSGWNIMDGFVVAISLADVLLTFVADGSPRIFGILRVFRLLRSLRPLRVINRAPGLKLVVQTLLSSLRPIGNIVLICCTFFVIFGILGVQLFKGAMYYCEGPNVSKVRTKADCLRDPRNLWLNRKYNFDHLGQALMSLFVLSSKDGWVNIMYTGLDAVGVDMQPIENYNEWRLLYFISFLLLVAFFVLNMFVGVVVENFHRCREQQEREEKARRAIKRAKKMDKKRRKMHEPPYYINYSKTRLVMHNLIISKYFDLVIAAVIGLNVITMAMEFYMMPKKLEYTLKVFNYFFTAVFIVEALMKLFALGIIRYCKNRWNQLDIFIVALSIAGIVLEKMESDLIPINPTIIRVMRVLRIARVLKLLKMAKGIRALLDTVMQALPQVGNLGLLFFLLFFIFAALGVELFGRLECTEEFPCEGLGEHAHFKDFGMAFLTLFRVATGDNWNGIMKDTLRDNCDQSSDCIKNCCISAVIAPVYFVVFVLMAQFVLVNVVVAVLMKHLEESHKQMDDDLEMDAELERELAAEAQQKTLLQVGQQVQQAMEDCQRERNVFNSKFKKPKPLRKMPSLPSNFIYTFDRKDDSVGLRYSSLNTHIARRTTDCIFQPDEEKNIALSPLSCLSDKSSGKNAQTITPISDIPSLTSPNSTHLTLSHRDNSAPTVKELKPDATDITPVQSSCRSGSINPMECISFQQQHPKRESSGSIAVLTDINSCRVQVVPTNENSLIEDPLLSDNASAKDGEDFSGQISIDIPHDCAKYCSHPSLTFSDPESENVPLLVRRLKQKLFVSGHESSFSSQSDIPENSRDKSQATDSTSLDL